MNITNCCTFFGLQSTCRENKLRLLHHIYRHSLKKSSFYNILLTFFRLLEENIASCSTSYQRPPCGNMRSFLLNCINGPLLGVNSHHIHLLCDDYEFARHHYETFDEAKFKVSINLLMDSVYLKSW